MRSILADNDEMQYPQDPDPAIFSDLKRWRCAVLVTDRHIFDEIAVVVWEQRGAYQDNWQLHNEELLAYFQSLFQSLVSATHAACFTSVGDNFTGNKTPPEDVQIQDPDEQLYLYTHGDDAYETNHHFDIVYNDAARAQIQCHDYTVIEPTIVLLAATTIFVAIVAFLTGT